MLWRLRPPAPPRDPAARDDAAANAGGADADAADAVAAAAAGDGAQHAGAAAQSLADAPNPAAPEQRPPLTFMGNVGNVTLAFFASLLPSWEG